MHNWNDHYIDGAAQWFIGMPIMALTIALVVWIVITAIRKNTHTPLVALATQNLNALHVLEERFARGEIDDEEFKKRSDVLRLHRHDKH
jgi:putative membrane protein